MPFKWDSWITHLNVINRLYIDIIVEFLKFKLNSYTYQYHCKSRCNKCPDQSWPQEQPTAAGMLNKYVNILIYLYCYWLCRSTKYWDRTFWNTTYNQWIIVHMFNKLVEEPQWTHKVHVRKTKHSVCFI